jgi:hypothetical protein
MATFIGVAAWMAAAPPTNGQQLQTFKDCVVGKRVSTNDGRKGTITRVDPAWSYCYVRFDDNGKEAGYLYSLLNSEGGAAKKDDLKLSPGVYECFASGHYTFMDMRITGADTYSMAGRAGKFRIEPTGKIVFETGPLSKYYSKLVSGGRIGLNTNGDSFYATTCELNRNKH